MALPVTQSALLTWNALVRSSIASQARIHGIPESDVVEKIMLSEAAIRRLLEPEEVAQLVTYLSQCRQWYHRQRTNN